MIYSLELSTINDVHRGIANAREKQFVSLTDIAGLFKKRWLETKEIYTKL